MKLFIDFETRSEADIKDCGADAYAAHPSTEVLCMGFAFDEEPAQIWTPRCEMPWDVLMQVSPEHAAGDTCFIAHNAPFEIAIWNEVCAKRYGFPRVQADQWLCTMAMAYAMALPGSLEKAAAALGIADGKDMAGHRLMLQLSQPRDIGPDGKAIWWEDEGRLSRLYQYCAKDIDVEREVYKRLLPLSESERKLWLLDHKINRRGVGIDLKAAGAAIRLVGDEKTRLDAEMRRVTNNAVATCSATKQLTDWLKFRGVSTSGVAKSDVSELLESASLPSDCRTALQLRQEAAKTSTAKLEKMIKGVCEDGRIKGLTQFHGANTGRFAGRRLQVHNFPRPTIPQEDIENVFSILEKVG